MSVPSVPPDTVHRDERALPRLHPEVQILRTGPRDFVLFDTRTQDHYEFGPAERFLLQWLGRSVPLDEVRKAFETRFGHPLTRERLLEFLEQLRNKGLLDDPSQRPEPAAPRRVGPHHVMSASPERSGAPDPKARLNFAFDVLALFLGWMVHPLMIVPILGAAVIATLVLIHDWNRAFDTFVSPTRTLPGIPLLVLVLLQTFIFVNAPRSFLLGVLVRRYGGRITEFGVRIWESALPTVYCEHSLDSWAVMPDRGKWAVLSFDIWYQLGYASLAIIGYEMSRPRSFEAVFCTWLLPALVLGLLLHCNIFIKYCGYHLITYAVDEIDLQERALAETWAWLNFRRSPEPLTRRQRYWFRAYGIGYWLVKVVLEGTLFICLWLWIKEKYHATGAVIWVAFVLWWYRASLIEFLNDSVPMRWFDRALGSVWYRWGVRLFLVGLFAAVGFLPYNYEIAGECRVVPAMVHGVRSQLADEVVEVNVAEGDSVARGDVLARLSGRTVEMERLTAEANLRKAEAQLDKLMTGYLDEEVQIARDNVEIAKDQLNEAQIEVIRVERMVRARAATDEELDERREALADAQDDLISARENLSLVQQGYRDEMIRQAEAQVKLCAEKLDYFERVTRLVELKAPAAGRVVLPYMHGRKGQHVEAGDLVAVVQDTSRLMVEVAADDPAALDVRDGQTVHVRLYTDHGALLTGRVRRVAPAAEVDDRFGNGLFRTDPEFFKERQLNSRGKNGLYEVRVYVDLDNPPPDLTSELYGYARIVVDEHDVFWRAMARPIAAFLRTQAWSWLP